MDEQKLEKYSPDVFKIFEKITLKNIAGVREYIGARTETNVKIHN